MYLAGDIGGTKTQLALFNKGSFNPIKEEKFPSQKYPSLEAIIQSFVTSGDHKIEAACFGVAGPVKQGICHTTNLPWLISANTISKIINIPSVAIINDLEANAYGIKVLNKKDFFEIQKGDSKVQGNQCLVSAGTGLGEAGLYYDGQEHHPFACEGGHVDFAPKNAEEIELLQFMLKELKHVSYERFLSGPGLYNLYRFYLSKESSPKHDIGNPLLAPQNITEKALKKECPVCEKALNTFTSIYGAESGNAALKFYALGGVYIGGGIAPHIKDSLASSVFLESFNNKGRLNSWLKDIPIHIILNPNTALLGAALYASTKI